MKRYVPILGFVLSTAASLVMLQSLSACSDKPISIDQVVHVLTMDNGAMRELKRFNKAYDKYSNDLHNERQRSHFRDAYRLVRANYIVKVDDAKLIDAALKGIEKMHPKPGAVKPVVLVEAALDSMLQSLDPHSSYLNPDEYKDMKMTNKGEFGGLGIEVRMESGLIKVVSPIEDTPAFRAGIQPGDIITHLDGVPVKGKTLSAAVKIMRGRPGVDINLTVLRGERAPFVVNIVRAIIQVRSVRWRREGNVGYVRLSGFTEQVGNKLTSAMSNLFDEAQAANVPLQGFVLDLRNNPGGLLTQALFVSDAFLESGEIVSVRERDPRKGRIYNAETGDLAHGLPIVVLINEGSASASEIVAGALKDHRRAVIMGRRSFGKGSVQSIHPMPAEGALRLTIARYYAPSGHTIQARGVAPNIVLNRPQSKDGEDDIKITKEADLPDILSGDNYQETAASVILPMESCPAAGPEGKDVELGCALAYIHAGTAQAFKKVVRLN